MKWINDWLDKQMHSYFKERCHSFINEQRHNRAQSNSLLKKRESELKKHSIYFKNKVAELETLLLRNTEESVGDRTNMWREIERLRGEIDRIVAKKVYDARCL